MPSDKGSIGWNELVVTPDEEAVAALREAWSWLLPQDYRPALFSALGDMFFECTTGEIRWLNTGTGEVTTVAVDLPSSKNC